MNKSGKRALFKFTVALKLLYQKDIKNTEHKWKQECDEEGT